MDKLFVEDAVRIDPHSRECEISDANFTPGFNGYTPRVEDANGNKFCLHNQHNITKRTKSEEGKTKEKINKTGL